MEISEILIPILIIATLIIFNGLFVAAEFAIVAAPRTRMAQLAEDGNAAAQHTLKILLEPALQNRYIATAQIGITIVSLALGGYGEFIFAEWILAALESVPTALAHTIATVTAVGLLTYLHVVIGEMIPKTLALQKAEKTVLALARPMQLIEFIFAIPVWLLNHIGDWVVRLLGIKPPDADDRMFSADELEYIVEESAERGELDPRVQIFIANILDLQERKVEQVMTPRTQVIGIPVDAAESLILQRVCETRKSRYPIYDTHLDNIRGFMHVKDFARHRAHQPNTAFVLADHIYEAIFIPETLQLSELLKKFRKEQLQLAIVVDEHGGMAGIVTIEDLIEEVVGEIQDEFDHEILPIEVIEKGKLLRVRGNLLLAELNQLHDLEFDETGAYTVGGLVMAHLGRIPVPRDQITLNGVRFEVESTERLAVQSVLVYLPEGEDHRDGSRSAG